MIRLFATMAAFALTATVTPAWADDRPRSQFDAAITAHARANGVPEALVHRVIVRESRYRPRVIGKGGAMGLMQIKTATARRLGYRGTAAGLLDPETNLTYAVRYLAGAYRLANGNHNRAVSYYARGYYHAAKSKGGTVEALAQPNPSTALRAYASGDVPGANQIDKADAAASAWENPLSSLLGLFQPMAATGQKSVPGDERKQPK